MARLRIAGVSRESIVDGPGLRFTVFTQGCRHACPGCHNPGTHDPEGGYDADTGELFEQIKKNPLLDGLTLSGGEPFLQPYACAELAARVRQNGLSVVTYTGYTFEALLGMDDDNIRALLRYTDLLVDGPFILSQRSLSLLFRGSKNQRLIDVKKSLSAGRAVECGYDADGLPVF